MPIQKARLCEEGNGECKTCLGSNCNSEKSFKKCLICTTADGLSCVLGSNSSIKSKTCKEYNADCFTYIDIAGVSRGCIGDSQGVILADVWHTNPDKYSICKTVEGDGCNNQEIRADDCIECDSTTGDQCRENPGLYEGKVCGGITTTLFNMEGCYMRVVSFPGILIENLKKIMI